MKNIKPIKLKTFKQFLFSNTVLKGMHSKDSLLLYKMMSNNVSQIAFYTNFMSLTT